MKSCAKEVLPAVLGYQCTQLQEYMLASSESPANSTLINNKLFYFNIVSTVTHNSNSCIVSCKERLFTSENCSTQYAGSYLNYVIILSPYTLDDKTRVSDIIIIMYIKWLTSGNLFKVDDFKGLK